MNLKKLQVTEFISESNATNPVGTYIHYDSEKYCQVYY